MAKKAMEKKATEKAAQGGRRLPTPDREHFPKLKDFRDQALEELEAQYMRDLMHVCDGEINKACELSGLSRARVYALLKHYAIQR
jgi:two-component system NtrC family response regulator